MLKASTGEYGDAVTKHYDHFYRSHEDQYLVADHCRTLLPDAHRLLEGGVGQGRLVIPLARAGSDVTDIDSSANIFERLGAASGGLDIHTAHGKGNKNFELGTFDIVLIGKSTFFMISTQEDQINPLSRAREYLRPERRLVVVTCNPFARVRGPRTQPLTLPCAPDTLMAEPLGNMTGGEVGDRGV